jgi:hypothetical protein
MAKRSRTSSLNGPGPESRSRPLSPESLASIPSKIHLPDSSSIPTVGEVMRCSLPPHRETLSFSSYDDYEVHYQQAHVNRCTECARNFPTDRFLNLHIEENHDPLIAARRERGEKTVWIYSALYRSRQLTSDIVWMLCRKLRAKMLYTAKAQNASHR